MKLQNLHALLAGLVIALMGAFPALADMSGIPSRPTFVSATVQAGATANIRIASNNAAAGRKAWQLQSLSGGTLRLASCLDGWGTCSAFMVATSDSGGGGYISDLTFTVPAGYANFNVIGLLANNQPVPTEDTGTFTAGIRSGGTLKASATAYYSKVGHQACVTIPTLTFTNTGGAVTIDGLPASLQPPVDTYFPLIVVNDSAASVAYGSVQAGTQLIAPTASYGTSGTDGILGFTGCWVTA